LGAALALLCGLFTQGFADQRDTVCRLAALERPIDEFELLLVEAHNHRSCRHSAPSLCPARPRAQRYVAKIIVRKGQRLGWSGSLFAQGRRFLKRLHAAATGAEFAQTKRMDVLL
jgi:hypothetical protein